MEQHVVQQKEFIHDSVLMFYEQAIKRCNRIVSSFKAELKSRKPPLKEQVEKIPLPNVYISEFA